ncbi:MAG: hypothetical protein HFG70_08530 [Hungatella sp.]|nr:hypothetical protein [Hungatella sp.]
MDNTTKTLKNSAFAVAGQIVTLFLSFINRRIFIIFLDIEFLGYQSLFSNVFSILSIADLGIGNLIHYHLYQGLANDDKEEISRIMNVYKLFYYVIAVGVLVVGGILSFFLPYIIKDTSLSWGYIKTIYFLQLGSVVLGYFMAYRRTLFICDQKEYECVKVDIYTSIVIQAVQLLALLTTKNYLVYLAVHLSTSTIANVVIARKSGKTYPYLKKKYKITKAYLAEKKLLADARDVVIHKLSYIVYSSTDNIIISVFESVRMVALYGNYYVLGTGLTALVTKVYGPFQATIGRIVYSHREKEEVWSQFRMLDLFSFFIAAMYGLGFLIYYQFAIEIWMGREYLLPFSFAAAYSATIFLTLDSEIIYRYRAAFGEFSIDKNYMVFSMITNIIVSIFLTKQFGVTGVQIGTLIAFLPIAYGRLKFVVGYYFEKRISDCIITHFLRFLIFSMEAVVAYFMTRKLDVSLIGFIERGMIWFILSIGLNSLIFFRDSRYRLMMNYVKLMIAIIKKQIDSKNK